MEVSKIYSICKIESCLQDSTPAAGRFSDIIPRRRSAIPWFYYTPILFLPSISSIVCQSKNCTFYSGGHMGDISQHAGLFQLIHLIGSCLSLDHFQK